LQRAASAVHAAVGEAQVLALERLDGFYGLGSANAVHDEFGLRPAAAGRHAVEQVLDSQDVLGGKAAAAAPDGSVDWFRHAPSSDLSTLRTEALNIERPRKRSDGVMPIVGVETV
jgi:hypothetical protein